MVDLDNYIIVPIFILFLLLTVSGYAYGLNPADNFIRFFSQPLPIFAWGLVFLFGVNWYVARFPASIWIFIAGMILYLGATNGVY